jgi:hypothetical protein
MVFFFFSLRSIKMNKNEKIISVYITVWAGTPNRGGLFDRIRTCVDPEKTTIIKEAKALRLIYFKKIKNRFWTKPSQLEWGIYKNLEDNIPYLHSANWTGPMEADHATDSQI